LFKFIIPKDENRKNVLLAIFSGMETDVTIKNSSGNKYQSISVESVFETPELIIEIYKKAAQIEGIIQL
jgi:putative lipoic acid-binding regulatory protein